MRPRRRNFVVVGNLEVEQVLKHSIFTDAQCIGWIGTRGEGKTESLITYLGVREPRVLAFDSFGSFTGIRLVDSIETALEDLQRFEVACRRRVQPEFSSDTHAYAEHAFKLIIECLRNCLVVLEELSLWTEPKITRRLRKLIIQGRQIGVRLLLVAQQVSLIPYELQSQMTHIVVFHLHRPADLDALERWVGKRIRKIVNRLDRFECVVVKL